MRRSFYADSAVHVADKGTKARSDTSLLLGAESQSLVRVRPSKMNIRSLPLLSLVLLQYFAGCCGQHGLGDMTYDERYLDGMRAYTEEKWAACVPHMQQAWKEYEKLHAATLECQRECEAKLVKVPDDYFPDTELVTFHRMIAASACLHLCKEHKVRVVRREGGREGERRGREVLSLSLPVYQVRLDWLPLPCIASIRPSQLSCLPR